MFFKSLNLTNFSCFFFTLPAKHEGAKQYHHCYLRGISHPPSPERNGMTKQSIVYTRKIAALTLAMTERTFAMTVGGNDDKKTFTITEGNACNRFIYLSFFPLVIIAQAL